MSWKRTKCIIDTCRATGAKYPGRKFFRFPKQGSENYNKWIEAVGPFAEKIKARKVPYICEIHFENSCVGKRLLKKKSIPTLFLFSKSESEILGNKLPPSRKTYGKSNILYEENDLTIEELNKAAMCIPSSYKVNHNVAPATCQECLNNNKKVHIYIRKINKLEKEVLKLKTLKEKFVKQNSNLKRRLIRYSKLYTLLKKEDLNTSIDSINGISLHAKTFSKLILCNNKSRTYNEEERWLSQCIFFRSSAGYRFLRDTLKLNLPSTTSLHNWVKIKSLSTGPNTFVLNEIKKQIATLSAREKDVVLLFDEMSVQKNLTFNEVKDKIEGFVDYGDSKRENVFAKSVNVFMIRSLLGSFKQVLYYVACPGSIPAKTLGYEVIKCVDIVSKLGLNVRAVTCDQGPTNRKFYSDYKISHESPIFHFNNLDIYAFYDAPHLFKSVRNNLINSNLLTPDGVISWRIIVTLYSIDKSGTTRICPKLTSAHITPSDFEKMSVRLAVQILSRSVAIGIRVLLESGKFPQELKEIALSTSKFLDKMNKLFDILNGNPAVTRDMYDLNFLQEMKNYVLQVKPQFKGDKTHCFRGLALTISSAINLSNFLFCMHNDMKFFSYKKPNQDPLENFFSRIRSRNFCKKNPSIFEFAQIFAKLLSIKIMFSSRFSNCDEDDDNILDIDWNTILENSSTSQTGALLNSSSTSQLKSVEGTECSQSGAFSENEEATVVEIDVSDAATRYFSGYCYLKTIKSLSRPCEMCESNMTYKQIDGDDISEILIKLKQYENIENFSTGLILPSDKFFKICRRHVKVFSSIFSNTPHKINLKSYMIDCCIDDIEKIYPDWFDKQNQCYDHRISCLKFFILVLLRKHCKWSTDATKNFKASRNIQKLINISNS